MWKIPLVSHVFQYIRGPPKNQFLNTRGAPRKTERARIYGVGRSDSLGIWNPRRPVKLRSTLHFLIANQPSLINIFCMIGESSMPFPKQTPRAFTKQDVEVIKPGQFGVYGLFMQGAWVYVGKRDIRTRLLCHLNGDNPRINRQQPTHWVSWVTSNMDDEEKRLIMELKPTCNQRVG